MYAFQDLFSLSLLFCRDVVQLCILQFGSKWFTAEKQEKEKERVLFLLQLRHTLW